MPLTNRWCCQTNEAQHPDPEHAADGDPIAPERLAREDRQHLQDQAEGRDDEDVDLGVPEEPEEVLPQVRRTAARGHEERGLADAVEHLHEDHAPPATGAASSPRKEVTKHPPDEERQLGHAQPRGALGEDRGDHVEAGQRDGEADQPEGDQVGVHAAHRLVGERRVARPAGGEAAEEDAGEQDQAGRRQQPEGERLEPREGHAPRADHDRHEVVAERPDDRRRGHEDHQHAVQPDQGQVRLGRGEGRLRA